MGSVHFAACGPKFWNDLSLYIRKMSDLDAFKTAVKTFLFKEAFFNLHYLMGPAQLNIACRTLRITNYLFIIIIIFLTRHYRLLFSLLLVSCCMPRSRQ